MRTLSNFLTMRVMAFTGAVLALCVITTNGVAQDDCDCVLWPWRPTSPCTEICRDRGQAGVDSDSYTYQQPDQFPRANFMASDAARLIYDQGFPETEYGFPVLSSDLYTDPERFGWTDVSAMPSKEGTIVVWPTMSGLVVDDVLEDSTAGLGNVQVLYPSHSKGGELTIGSARWLGKGARPKFIVPTSVVRNSVLRRIYAKQDVEDEHEKDEAEE